MSFKDHFSKQAADYAIFRPSYPQELFVYLGSVAPARQLAWDCGTGNGQAAVGLASVFARVIAASAYHLLQIEPAIDEVVNRYYYEVVESFWPPERKLVEGFADLPFSFHELDPPKFEMRASWNLDHLAGYLRTWSSTQRFIAATGRDPLKEIMDELRVAWGAPEQTRKVIWPVVLRVGLKGMPKPPME